MAANSETILSNQTHVGDSSAQTVTSDKYKGDGYYGRSDGLHTVQIDLNGFLGNIELQGTLAVNPTADDWFAVTLGGVGQSVDTTGKVISSGVSVSKLEYTTNETSNTSYNFTGNFVWVRVYISNWTDGSVTSVKFNH